MEMSRNFGEPEASEVAPRQELPEASQSPTGLLHDFVLPLLVISCLTILALLAGVHFSVSAIDSESAAREEMLARNGLALRIEEVAEMVLPQTNWDDAVRNLDNAYDPSWAASNVNEFLNHAYGFQGTYVLDAADSPLFSAQSGSVARPDTYLTIAPSVAGLVAAVRKQEAARGPIQRQPHSTDMISKPIQASALKLLGNQLNIVTVTLIQPDFGTALPKGPRSAVLVTTMPVNGPFLAGFSKRFLLHGIAVGLAPQEAGSDKAEIPARDESGKPVAWLSWKPLDPGYAMLHRMAMPILCALLVLAAIGAFQLRRVFQGARGLIEREALARELAFRDPLTGLPNRNSFGQQLEWQLSEMAPLASAIAVTCLRLPQLHDIAARLGLGARDQFVAIVASRLAKVCRADSMLARIGADEFAVMSLTEQPQEAVLLADRLRSSLDTPIALAGGTIPVVVQVGSSVTQIPLPAAHLIHDAYLAALQRSPVSVPDGAA